MVLGVLGAGLDTFFFILTPQPPKCMWIPPWVFALFRGGLPRNAAVEARAVWNEAGPWSNPARAHLRTPST